MRALAASLLTFATGCSWLFHEHESDYRGGHEPRCSTTHGWVVLDAVFGGINLAAATSALTTNIASDAQTGIVAGGLIWGAIHTASLITGEHWISECERARREYDGDREGGSEYVTGGEDSPEAAALRRERAEAMKQHAADESQRTVVEGEKPVYCATTDTPDVGVCNIDPERCEVAKRDGEAHGVHYTDCTARNAAACFSYNAVLTGARGTTCTPSIKNCDETLASFAANPDYKVLAKQCGVYRVKSPPPSEP